MTLREVYAEPGEYTIKMIIDPARAQTVDGVRVQVRNADGQDMMMSYKRWGTKITIQVKIDETTPDGVSLISIDLTQRDRTTTERFGFWSIK